jgi:hypothetical protein
LVLFEKCLGSGEDVSKINLVTLKSGFSPLVN